MKTTKYTYYKADGTIAYTKNRFDNTDGSKTFCFEQPNGVKNVKGIRRELYNLPAVINAQRVYFVEGEKCADAIIEQGEVATTLDSGANSHWESYYLEYLTDKEIIIIPDNDDVGMKYAKRISNNIPHSKIVPLPDLENKGDVYDWLKNGHKLSEIETLPCWNDEKRDKCSDDIFDKKAQADKIVELADRYGITTFLDTRKEAFAAVDICSHTEIWSIESKDFKQFLIKIYYDTFKKTPKNESVIQAINCISSQARFNLLENDEEELVKLSTRVAKDNNGIWYNLCDRKWRTVRITADGWNIVDKSPLLFRRYKHQLPQIEPTENGNVQLILKYFNIQNNQTLFLCWLISCFIPDFPHPMPIFFGEKGAAKTTACILLKKLIDPSLLETLTIPRESRSLVVNLTQHWFLPFDNISHIDYETSDTLCRAITGAGIQNRKLYTDEEDCIFTFQKCIAINGINNVADKSDLLDRSIMVELHRINESKRKGLDELYEEFDKDLPIILGGIIDILVKTLKIYPSVKLDNLPRMADFARWGYAIGEALGGLGKTFLDEYKSNQRMRNIEVLNSDIVATLIIAFMNNKECWSGKVSELYNLLTETAPKQGINTKQNGFPSKPNVLSRRLNAIRSNLEEEGITFETKSTASGTQIDLTNRKIPSLPPYTQCISSEKTDIEDKYEEDIDVDF